VAFGKKKKKDSEWMEIRQTRHREFNSVCRNII